MEPFTRSTIFENRSPISTQYPLHLKPHFFYYHTNLEIARIEIPAYIQQNATSVNLLMRLIADQVEKGNGYPVAIAEAHEQAVVKGPDRQFFYELLTALSVEQSRRLIPSQKSMKKRRMSV